MMFVRWVAVVAGVSLLTACNLAPFYKKPPVEMPVTWKLEGPWRVGTPNDGAPKGTWWKRFGDPQLDTLVEKSLTASPTLRNDCSGRLGDGCVTLRTQLGEKCCLANARSTGDENALHCFRA